MFRKVAILRGINVGGKRKILMADLKSLCGNLGWKNVESYIQSGNLIFSSEMQNSVLETGLEQAIAKKFGFDVPVIVRDSKELQASTENNPFYKENADISQLHLTFLKEKPAKENTNEFLNFNSEPDNFEIEGKDVFIHCTGKYHKSKLTNNFIEKKLNTGATTRNWKTVLKLYELSKKNELKATYENK